MRLGESPATQSRHRRECVRVRLFLIATVAVLAGALSPVEAQNPFTGEGGRAGPAREQETPFEEGTDRAHSAEAEPSTSALRERLISLGSGRPIFPRLNAFLRGQQRALNERIATLIGDATGRPAAPDETEGAVATGTGGSTSAVLVIGFVAFLYGLLHAALPGHRKVLLVSYFISSDAPVRHGVFAGVGVAVIHSLAAVAVVLGAYYVLETSLSVALDDATRYLQALTAAGILIVGALLMVSKAREAWNLRNTSRDNSEKSSRREADRGHTGHEHGEGLIRRMKGRLGLLPAIVVSAVVPCPGSAMILIFALSLGVLSLGLYAVVLFSVGMAVTLTTVSVVAIVSKRIVLGAFDGRMGEVLHVGIEGAAGAVMIAFGLVLLLPFLL